MGPIHDADLAALTSLTGDLCVALESIKAHQWTLPTPCIGWDLAALIDHVVGGNWFTIQIFAGQAVDEALTLTMERFEGSDMTSEKAASSVNDQLTAFAQPGVLDRTWNHVAGDLTGGQILRLRLHDLIIHTWDIIQALNPPASIPEELVRWGLEVLAGGESLTSKHFGLASVPNPDTASAPEAAYLLRFGR